MDDHEKLNKFYSNVEDQFIHIYLCLSLLFMFTRKLTSSCQLPLCTLLYTLYANIYSDIQCSLSWVDLVSNLYSGDPDVEIFKQPLFTYKPEIIPITVPVFFIRSYIVGSLFGSTLFISVLLCFTLPCSLFSAWRLNRSSWCLQNPRSPAWPLFPSSYRHSGLGGQRPGSIKQRVNSLPRE